MSPMIRTVGTARLNLRADSRIDADVLGTLYRGQIVTVLRKVYGTWAQVRLQDGREGYVWAQNLQ